MHRLRLRLSRICRRAAAVAAAMSCAVCGLAADGYPSRPVRLVVPFAAGSATDTMARLLAQELSPRLGQSVVVENKAGGLGQIAAQHVARSAPDGYTLFVTTNTTHSANPHLFRTLPYDPVKDFEPIARTATLPFMLVVNGQLPVRSTAGFLSYAKANPGKLTYASASSTSLIAAESLNVLGHVSMIGVYYKASPQAILDVASGQVQVMVADFATAMPHVTAGRLKVLAVTTAKRSSLVPDAPPLAESVKGFDVTSWNGLFAPAGTPPAIVQRLARETLALLARPDVKSRLAAIGFEVDPLGPQDFAAYVRNQLDYWGRLVRDAGIKPE